MFCCCGWLDELYGPDELGCILDGSGGFIYGVLSNIFLLWPELVSFVDNDVLLFICVLECIEGPEGSSI